MRSLSLSLWQNYISRWESACRRAILQLRGPVQEAKAILWEQGWRSGESARLPPVCPGFDSRTRRHMWVEFVVGSLLAPRGFSPGTPVFLSSPPPLPHQCVPGSIPGPDFLCGLSLLLVLSLKSLILQHEVRAPFRVEPPREEHICSCPV